MTLFDEPTDLALDERDDETDDFTRDLERRDRTREREDGAPHPRCFYCGGSGYRCCEFGRDLRAGERRAAAQLHGHRSGTVTAAPIAAPLLNESRRSIA